MKFFNRKREFVYFCNLDSRVKTMNHYDVFMFGTELSDHSAEHIATFDTKNYAQLFTLFPVIYRELHGARMDLALVEKNNKAYARAKSIDELITCIDGILSEVQQ